MWDSIFGLDLPVWEKILRAVLIYVFLVVALRLAGKRELAQLNTLDFVVLLAVANAVQNGLIGNDDSVTGAWLGAGVLFALNGGFAFVLYRQARLRRLVEGTPTVLIRDGVLDRAALRRESLDEPELQDAIEEAGVFTYADVEFAKLTTGGKIVVEPKTDDQSAARYAELTRRLDDLTAAVARIEAALAPPDRRR